MQSGRLEFKIYRSELNFDLYVFVYAGNIHDLFDHMMKRLCFFPSRRHGNMFLFRPCGIRSDRLNEADVNDARRQDCSFPS